MAAARVPLAHPIWGHWFTFTHDQLDALEQLVAYGDWVPLRFPPLSVAFINHPALIEEVLVTRAHDFIKPLTIRRFKPVFGEGVFTSEGTLWRRQRRLLQPAFHRERIRTYAERMVQLGVHWLAGWSDADEPDLHVELTRLTLAIVADTLFGMDISGDADLVAAAVTQAVHALERRAESVGMLIPDALPTPNNLRLRHSVRILNRVAYRIIAERRATRSADRHDFLSLLLEARDEDGNPLSDRQVRDEVMTMILAGHETTAVALTWAMYLLARHPAAQARLQTELHSVLGDRAPGIDDLPRLPYTGQVINEALRLYPPAWAIERESLRALQIGGHRLRRGSTVLISPWTVHRDPRWFDRPLSFEPERWAPELGLLKRLPRFAYLPFGGGPRGCLGNTFALTEASLLLALIGQRFRLHLLSETPPVPEPAVTLRPRGGLRMRIERIGPVPTIRRCLSASTPH